MGAAVSESDEAAAASLREAAKCWGWIGVRDVNPGTGIKRRDATFVGRRKAGHRLGDGWVLVHCALAYAGSWYWQQTEELPDLQALALEGQSDI